MSDLDPIVMHFEVPLTPAEAFELFTSELDSWWPLVGHSCSDDEHAKVHFDQRVGGEVTESSAKASAPFVWGTLSEWNPPSGFAMSWHPGQAPENATQLTVSFAQTAAGSRVTLVHDGWAARGAEGARARDMYASGWVGVTDLYRTRATSHG